MQETSDNIIHFKIRTFISLVAGLVIGTNVVNTILHNISDNTDAIEYNAKAEIRRRIHSEEKQELKSTIKEQAHKIEILTEKLNKCQ